MFLNIFLSLLILRKHNEPKLKTYLVTKWEKFVKASFRFIKPNKTKCWETVSITMSISLNSFPSRFSNITEFEKYFLLKLFSCRFFFSVIRKFWSLTALKYNTFLSWELKGWETFNIFAAFCGWVSEYIELSFLFLFSKIFKGQARMLLFHILLINF